MSDRAIVRTDPESSRFTATGKAWGGPGVGIVEIQVSLSPPDSRGRGSIVCMGVNSSEVKQIGHAILRLPQFTEHFTHNLQIRLIGDDRHRRMYGLALTLAMSSAFLHRAIPSDHLYIGEVDLDRNVRGVSPNQIVEILSALDAGDIQRPLTLFAPTWATHVFHNVDEVIAVPSDTLAQVLLSTWPQTSSKAKRKSR